MSKVIKNTTFYTIGYILPKVAHFLLVPIYSRYLSPSDYGITQSMAVLSAILTVFFSLQIPRSISRLYFDYNKLEEKRKYLGTVFVATLLISTFMLILMFICKSILVNIFKDIAFYPYYFYTLLSIYLTSFSYIPMAYYQVEQKANKFILLSLLQFTVNTLLCIVFVVILKQGAKGMLLGNLIGNICLLPVFILITIKVISFNFNLVIFKETLIYSWPLIPAALSAWILNLSDRIFIERYFTLADVGLYSMSYKVAEVLLVFSSSFHAAYEPFFYQLSNQFDQNKAKTTLIRYNKVFIIILILSSLTISLFSKEFFLLLDQRYYEAYKLVPLIITGILFSQISGLANKAIYQSKKTKQLMLIMLSSAVMNILLNFLIVPKYGAFGAALTTTITFIVFFIIQYEYSKKCYFIPIPWKEIIPFFFIYISTNAIFVIVDLPILIGFIIKIFILSMLIIFIFKKYHDIIINMLPQKLRNIFLKIRLILGFDFNKYN